MPDFLIAILVLYVVAVIAVTIVSLLLLLDMERICLLTPREIYEETNYNWFGCIFIWFLEFIINPIMWIGITIAGMVEWLFTVGRK